jgi:hypothetical protein
MVLVVLVVLTGDNLQGAAVMDGQTTAEQRGWIQNMAHPSYDMLYHLYTTILYRPLCSVDARPAPKTPIQHAQ